jgi:hypothetical protein
MSYRIIGGGCGGGLFQSIIGGGAGNGGSSTAVNWDNFKKRDFPKLIDKIGKFPLYSYLLCRKEDQNLASFIRSHVYFLHNLSGEDCRLYALGNTVHWDTDWKQDWLKKLEDPKTKSIFEDWIGNTPFELKDSFEIAKQLNIELNKLPCAVFLEDLKKDNLLCISIKLNDKKLLDEDEFENFFTLLFDKVHKASQATPGLRLERLKDLLSENKQFSLDSTTSTTIKENLAWTILLLKQI